MNHLGFPIELWHLYIRLFYFSLSNLDSLHSFFLAWLHWQEPFKHCWMEMTTMDIIIFFLIWGERHWNLWPWVMLTLQISLDSLYQTKKVPFYLHFILLRTFIKNKHWISSNNFLYPVRWSCFFSFIPLIQWMNTEIDLGMLNQPCISGINLFYLII